MLMRVVDISISYIIIIYKIYSINIKKRNYKIKLFLSSNFPLIKNKKPGNNLFSQQGISQVSSAPKGLTSVFGMGTGFSLQVMVTRNSLCTSFNLSTLKNTQINISSRVNLSWLSPRSISTGQLHASLHLHLQPIYQVVFLESYYLAIWDILS